MLKVGDRCVFRTPPEHLHQEGFTRWEGVTGCVARVNGGNRISMLLDKAPSFWYHSNPPVFEGRLLQPLRDLSPLEQDIVAYIDSEKRQLGLL